MSRAVMYQTKLRAEREKEIKAGNTSILKQSLPIRVCVLTLFLFLSLNLLAQTLHIKHFTESNRDTTPGSYIRTLLIFIVIFDPQYRQP